MAWAAVYMLTEDPLPDWASGRRVLSAGGQTNRPVDDVGLVTDAGGWVTIQAKKGMQVGRGEGGGLGEALRQLVEIDAVGVPDGSSDALRPLDAGRDLVLILSDDSAPQTVNGNLFSVVKRLRELPAAVPVDDVAPSGKQADALEVLRGHLRRCWRARWQRDMTDADYRRLTSVLSVRALHIADGGEDFATMERYPVQHGTPAFTEDAAGLLIRSSQAAEVHRRSPRTVTSLVTSLPTSLSDSNTTPIDLPASSQCHAVPEHHPSHRRRCLSTAPWLSELHDGTSGPLLLPRCAQCTPAREWHTPAAHPRATAHHAVPGGGR